MKTCSDNTLIWIVLICVMIYGCQTREALLDRTTPVEEVETQ